MHLEVPPCPRASPASPNFGRRREEKRGRKRPGCVCSSEIDSLDGVPRLPCRVRNLSAAKEEKVRGKAYLLRERRAYWHCSHESQRLPDHTLRHKTSQRSMLR